MPSSIRILLTLMEYRYISFVTFSPPSLIESGGPPKESFTMSSDFRMTEPRYLSG